ncbi:MAG: hypothetical protein QM530_07925 [Phycisphaerales bacterium]|nr:hypothetical protein [Phycisphaerales bacterium]
MNVRNQILQEHSKKNANLIASWIGNKQERFDELMQLFLHDEYRVTQRCAWVVGFYGESHPEMLLPYLGKMLKRCTEKGIHVAIKRNVTRTLQFIKIPEEHHSAVLNLCFDFLIDPKEAIAVRCFSMGALANLCVTHPDIGNELRTVIEDALAHEELSPGFISKSKKTLKLLNGKDGKKKIHR